MSTCAACGQTATSPLFTVRGFDIVQCSCGLPRTVLPPGFDLKSIYSEAYYQGGHSDGYADYAGSADALRIEFQQVLTALGRNIDGGKLIELGCAYGYLLEEARPKFEVCGVELSDHAREACVARGLDVVAAPTEEFLASHGPFDAAVMLDVIEHMEDPGKVLDMLHANMRESAQLVVTTGDWDSVLARVMRKHWRLMTPPQHVWFFSRKTLTALLARHGFEVHTFERPWKQVPLNLVAYQFTRYVRSQSVLRKIRIPGSLMLNLFDAMRLIAVRR